MGVTLVPISKKHENRPLAVFSFRRRRAYRCFLKIGTRSGGREQTQGISKIILAPVVTKKLTPTGGVGFLLCGDFFNKAVKGDWVLLGKLRKHLAVYFYPSFFEESHECAIRVAARAECCVDANLPQCAEISFLVMAMGERISACMDDCFSRRALF